MIRRNIFDACNANAIVRRRSQDCDSKTYYVAIEKILTGDEQLPQNWPVHGTTGYDFANLVNGLFVNSEASGRMDRIYRAFIGHHADFDWLAYECRKLVMDRALASELNVLANSMSRIALADRHTCDFTVNNLRDALMEIVASFPVYRTYVTDKEVSPQDRKYVSHAVGLARQRSSVADGSVFDFIQRMLLTEEGVRPWPDLSGACSRLCTQISAIQQRGDGQGYRRHQFLSL